MTTDVWESIIANDYAIPAEMPVNDLVDALFDLLGSPDPRERDNFAYFILAHWILRGQLNDDMMRGMLMRLVTNMAKGLGESGNDGVLLRSFSALILATLIGRDNRQGFLRREEAENLLRWTLEYLAQERDWRGYDADKGWMHAVAHTADALRMLSNNRHMTADDIRTMLDGIAARLTAPSDFIFTHDEDDRLAAAVTVAIQRSLLTETQWAVWFERLATVKQLASSQDPFDPAVFAALQNTKRFVHSLYFRLALLDGPTPQDEALRERLLETVKALRD